MTTSVSKTTPMSAPRDPQGLMKIGIFQLRILIEACGGLTSNEEKMAFAKMSVEEKVNLAMQLLAQWDRANPGGGAMPMNGAAGHAAPAPMQMMPAPQGMPMTQVDPAAVAAAAAAAAPQAPPPTTRKPRNAATQTQQDSPAPDLGVDVLNLLNRIVTQNDESAAMVASGIKEMLGQISTANATNAENTSNYKAVYGALTAMNGTLANVQFQTKLAMALVLPLAEQVLGASREQILQAALGDVDTVGQILAQAANPGKG